MAGAFASHDDDALFPFEASPSTNTNGIYQELVLTGRHDYVAANTLIDKMNSLNDPRLASYFTMVGDTAYIGGTYGASSPYGSYSHVAGQVLVPDLPGYILTYDQQMFYLAEAAARGWNAGVTAESAYNTAISASFDLWNAGDASAYIASADVAYDQANWKELIGTQSWIAFYTRGVEGWTQWRRLDSPAFNMPPNPKSDAVPTRMIYPIYEATLNKANYQAAASAIGGDNLTTKLFWDKY